MRSLSPRFKNDYHLQGVTAYFYSTLKDTKYTRGVQDMQVADCGSPGYVAQPITSASVRSRTTGLDGPPLSEP